MILVCFSFNIVGIHKIFFSKISLRNERFKALSGKMDVVVIVVSMKNEKVRCCLVISAMIVILLIIPTDLAPVSTDLKLFAISSF